MGLFDSIVKNAQKTLNEKIDGFNKKVEAAQSKITATPLDTLIKEVAVKEHKKAVKNHAPKPDRSIEGISKQILAQRNSFIKNGFKEYEFIANRDCCEKCAELNGKHFAIKDLKIGVNAPPMHEGCKCSIAAYEDAEEYKKWLNSF